MHLAKTPDGKEARRMNTSIEQFIDNKNRDVAAKIYEDGMTIETLRTWIEQASGMIAKRRALKILDSAGVDDDVTVASLRAETAVVEDLGPK